jgi:mono/diheme cytochrome c family protein
MHTFQRFILAGLTAAVGLAAPFAAQADGDDRGARVPLLPLYTQECGSCHAAYPPGMLPAASWQRLMGNLGKHFGTDASLAAAEQKAVADWLMAHAGTGKRSSATPPPEDRITRSAWFVREHDEVAPASWKRASIKSAANCAACHARADEGSYREREIRIPK